MLIEISQSKNTTTFPTASEGSIPQARGESANENAAYSIIETVLPDYQTEPAEGEIA